MMVPAAIFMAPPSGGDDAILQDLPALFSIKAVAALPVGASPDAKNRFPLFHAKLMGAAS
ncbi:hypothetical protein [Novosphingobium sp.]|uniref:hypothetical protein n=1 Tax=Novosphingobium sp. TaxID=1874826 RepID=UPI0022BF4340|nr:hypothetical protein [Novosphingobium sp.]MCZ8019131.1 hypothetical protein [Novosphingobium sp.]MCZ8034939.1 hypothetical protein [Novosphingobium sp.]MCZ8052507.1 hypothetical protein [Novosphingobium sp.]MCZ8058606.1 hypothetical protein [Novosphingobium sp.]MCZ8233003.1 hypothetical protein [Novosphingobium sp.]